MEPRVFIGSTGEAHDLAVVLESLLQRVAAVTVWSQGVFEENKSNLENLLQAANDFDYACVFATADDFLVSKGEMFQAPRDNILFEFGLFLGAFGRDRVFLLHPRDLKLKMPTDLSGVTLLDFKPVDSKNTAKSVLGPPALNY
jgi:predicted nucleotide-binding protein